MSQPVQDPAFWAERLAKAETQHHAVYRCTLEKWMEIAERHRALLARVVQPTWKVLDAGCGWGRLLNLLPNDWHGEYIGVDISPDFVQLARVTYPGREFVCWDLKEFSKYKPQIEADICITVSLRRMIIREYGEAEWQRMLNALRIRALRFLHLEYDEPDGELEC